MKYIKNFNESIDNPIFDHQIVMDAFIESTEIDGFTHLLEYSPDKTSFGFYLTMNNQENIFSEDLDTTLDGAIFKSSKIAESYNKIESALVSIKASFDKLLITYDKAEYELFITKMSNSVSIDFTAYERIDRK